MGKATLAAAHNGLVWVILHPAVSLNMIEDVLGYLPQMLHAADQRPAKEQLHSRYSHGGGWNPMPKFRLDVDSKRLNYPGDPPLNPVACVNLREEKVYLYPNSIVMILQGDDSFEVARLD